MHPLHDIHQTVNSCHVLPSAAVSLLELEVNIYGLVPFPQDGVGMPLLQLLQPIQRSRSRATSLTARRR